MTGAGVPWKQGVAGEGDWTFAGPPPAPHPLDATSHDDAAFTSGFEGPWTADPTAWDNSYFKNLLTYDWAPWVGPGGHTQWQAVQTDDDALVAPAADGNGTQPVMMMTSDVSLVSGDPSYLALVELYASNQSALDDAFKNAWYKARINPHHTPSDVFLSYPCLACSRL